MTKRHHDSHDPHPVIPPIELDCEQRERLDAGIASLNERDRTIFLASSRERASYAKIARRHHCSVDEVRRTISHVLVTLHEAVWPRER